MLERFFIEALELLEALCFFIEDKVTEDAAELRVESLNLNQSSLSLCSQMVLITFAFSPFLIAFSIVYIAHIQWFF